MDRKPQALIDKVSLLLACPISKTYGQKASGPDRSGLKQASLGDHVTLGQDRQGKLHGGDNKNEESMQG